MSTEPLYPVFGMPKAHVKMIDDRARTDGYIEALCELVRPGSIVVDIGTGTGILAAAAARAGARHVYAIETGRSAETATRLFEGNGLADRITLIRGWSTSIDLPEPADVVVSETIGREPLEQRILELLLDARERMLKPGGHLIPRAMAIYAVPVSIPPQELDRMDFTPPTVERWSRLYGIDFRPLLAAPLPRVTFKDASAVRRWARVSKPIQVADVDFTTYTEPVLDTTAAGVATRSAIINGVVLSFDVQLSERASFTTDLERASDTNSWRHAVFFPPPFEVEAGEGLVVSYRYGVGEPDGISIERAADRAV